jgi:pyroglutamyl-peptidase
MRPSKPANSNVSATLTGRRPDGTAAPRVLLTGFEPFGEDRYDPVPLNASWLAVRALHGEHIAGHEMVASQLPAVFESSIEVLEGLLRSQRPRLVICVGQASGRSAVSLERVAINLRDARIPDNAGAQPVDEPVIAGAPTAYFSSLPLKAMRRALEAGGLPVEVSQTAGTFVCNHVFYGLMHVLSKQRSRHKVRGGFIHVPCLPEQGSPSLPLENQIGALRLAVACALGTETDIVETAGSIS